MMQYRSDGLLLTERTVEATRARAAAPFKGSSCRRQPWLEPTRRLGALGSLMGAAGGLADAARSITSQGAVTVGRLLASRMAVPGPKHIGAKPLVALEGQRARDRRPNIYPNLRRERGR